jgi:hypothetical protein
MRDYTPKKQPVNYLLWIYRETDHSLYFRAVYDTVSKEKLKSEDPMTGIADDSDSAITMALEAAKRLNAKDPGHELLHYIKDLDEDAVYAAFVERFSKKDTSRHQRPNSFNTGWMWAQYLIALRKALGEELPTPLIETKPETPRVPSIHDQDPIPF